jgi:hypothetical protein
MKENLEELLELINAHLRDGLLFYTGVAKATNPHTAHEDNRYTHFTDAYAYSIGGNNSGKPDVVIFCGAGPNEVFNAEQLLHELTIGVQSLGTMLNQHNNDTTVVTPNSMLEVETGRQYIVFPKDEEMEKQIKIMYLNLANEFYQRLDYDIVILVPQPKEERPKYLH